MGAPACDGGEGGAELGCVGWGEFGLFGDGPDRIGGADNVHLGNETGLSV